MKVDNFVLLIISIVTLIVISLLTECNRGRLTELENKATKEIVETFFHLGSAADTESGQWGYQITGITQGKYGGRSRQQVINKLLEVGSHSENDYITETEKDAYGSGLFDSTISGEIEAPTSCSYNWDSCIWVDSQGTPVSKESDGQYARTIINYEPQNYHNSNCPYNRNNQVVMHSNLPSNKQTCATDLPPVNCLYENVYYNIDNFMKVPYSIFTKNNDKQYTGSSCAQLYGNNIDTTTKTYFTNDSSVPGSKRLPDIFGLPPYDTRNSNSSKIYFYIAPSNKKHGWKILTKDFVVQVFNPIPLFNISGITCHMSNRLDITIEYNLYITEEEENYKIYITFKVTNVINNSIQGFCIPPQLGGAAVVTLTNVNNFIKDKLENKIIFSVESHSIGYSKTGPTEKLYISFTVNNYIDSNLISLGNLNSIVADINISSPDNNVKTITIGEISNVIELEESVTQANVSISGASIKMEYKGILFKNLIDKFKASINPFTNLALNQ